MPDSASHDPLGRVLIGMSSEAFSQRQQEILLKAAILALCALLFTFLFARRLALSLSCPISDMAGALEAIQQGDYHTPCPSATMRNWVHWRGISMTRQTTCTGPASNSSARWHN